MELVIELSEPLDLRRGQPVLRLDGWVEYGYSQTSFAAWQAGVAARPLTLERWSEGRWETVLDQFGYPAGMPREATVPLPKTVAGSQRMRLSTNQQIYLDRVDVVYAIDADVRHVVHEAVAAEMRRVGFARRTDLPQHRPHYEYAERAQFWDTRYPQGLYTALGPALPLVTAQDNALAIIGPGDELHFEFAEPTVELPDGWRREYVLEFRGWAKDMDLYTRDGGTVEPLPALGPVSDQSRELQQRFTTRHQDGKS